MKFARSLMLAVCSVASALPVTAGPLAGAITREAVRLAAGGEPTGGEAVWQSGTPAESNWSRARTLASGTEIFLTTKGGPPGRRYVLLVDQSELTVLNLTDLILQSAATRVLLDIASRHPEYLAGAPTGARFVDHHVRVVPDGVFVADRKVADLGQLVERITRPDVVEIKTAKSPDAAPAAAVLGALMGYFGGAMAGARIWQAAGADPSNLSFIVWGGGSGGVAGGMLAYRAAKHRAKEHVVYRAT